MDLKDFIKWYESAYGRAVMNVDKFHEDAAYLNGFADAISSKTNRRELRKISLALRNAANLVECMNRKSKEPVDKG